jgi:hypothetical protein
MPCACKQNQPEYPITDNWGPSLWQILHGLAEKGVKAIFPSFRDDEKRQWILLIELLPKIIPCPMCREHAQEWILRHPISPIKDLGQDDLYDWLTNWVYIFHEAVNARTGKPSFDKALLHQTYGNININHIYKSMKPYIEINYNLVKKSYFPYTLDKILNEIIKLNNI